MRRQITVSIMALGLALPVMTLQAQDEARPGRGPGGERRGGPAFLATLDANKDGKLDKSEINESTAALKKLDKDSDGKLTMAELRGAQGRGPRPEGDRPPRPEGAERPERPDRAQNEANAGARPALPPLLATLDTNKDGSLEASELAGAPAALLKLDKNGDGELTREELQPGQGQRGPRGANGEQPPGQGRPRQNTPQP